MIIQPASISAKPANLKSRRRGAALIIAVIIFAAAALYLVTYFVMTQNEYTAVARSQTWNNSLTLAEAGVEDAMALINKNAGQIGSLPSWNVTAASQDNWSDLGNNVFKMSRWLGTTAGSSNMGYYEVYVTNNVSGTNYGPSILSIGYATWNGSSATFNSGAPVRKILVQTQPNSLPNGDLVSITNTTFNGNGVSVDSFDSSDPHHSDWQTTLFYNGHNYGIYPANPMGASGDTNLAEPYKRKDNAIVATDASSITIQNANVAGWVDTAPGGQASFQGNGVVGDVHWTFVTPQSGIQTNRLRNDMNVVFPPVSLPITNWVNTTASVITNGPNGYYYKFANQLKSSLTVQGTNLVIWLANGMVLSGSSDTLTVTNDSFNNCGVTFYVDGQFQMKGSAVINNGCNYALAFTIYGLPDCSLIDLGGNGAFTGYVYAPSCLLQGNGGGNNNTDLIGAFIVGSISFNGHVNFHYDEALSQNSPSISYKAVSWQEL
jgi:hypothetical protein